MFSRGYAGRDWRWFVAALPAAFLAAGCGGDGGILESALEQTIVLGVGELAQTTDGDLAIRFVELSEDSRCPTDVVCVWAGNGQVVIQLEPIEGPPVVEVLNTNQDVGPREIVFREHRLELIALMPLPVSTRPIPPGKYEAEIRITRESP